MLFDVGAEELVRRISGRRTCSLCNKVFNIYTAPPDVPAVDCVPGSNEHQLFQRKDDEEATVKERLRVYEENTRPVLSYYSDAGLLRTVQAEGALQRSRSGCSTRCGPAGQVAPKPAAEEIRVHARQASHRPRKSPRPQAGAPQAGAQGQEVGGAAPGAWTRPRAAVRKVARKVDAQGAPRAAQVKALTAACFRALPRASRAAG